MISFKILQKDKKSHARIGELHTPHGVVHTPAFVPVGTQATVKSLTPDDLRNIGVEILFGNTYHLHLRPGEEVIEQFGGLGKFMGWSSTTMTDSGGFQVFSLAHENPRSPATPLEETPQLVKITEDGVVFRSHLDGSVHIFTPEQSIAIQKKLGADIMLAFDHCSSYPIAYESAKTDVERTHQWALRSLAAFQKQGKFDQVLYGIIQGSVFEDLRKVSAQFISQQNFDGIAIGGVAVGEEKKQMTSVLDWTVPFLPDGKVRHLLGVGDVDDIFAIIQRGIDTFDCVTPSRLGRVGHVFIHPPEGRLHNRFRYDITKSVYASDQRPLSSDCICYVCQNFTRGYIQHLFRAKELLAYRLATYHNVYFIINLVKKIREAIMDEKFEKLKKKWLG